MKEKIINGIKLKAVGVEKDVYFDMAKAMYDEIVSHNKKGEKTVMIVPVGPTDQYPILADMINEGDVSLKNVHFFNMDEYMVSKTETISAEDPLCFEGRMKREFYDRVREDLVMPESQRHFPRVGREAEYDKMLEDLGGADACFGGLGINGHVAFNEPPEPNEKITADEFANLGTRVLPISRETKAINAYGYNRGDLLGMPQWCVTVGMKQILASKKIYIALNRPWQYGPLKHALFDDETATCPASLLRRVKDVTYCMYSDVAEGLF